MQALAQLYLSETQTANVARERGDLMATWIWFALGGASVLIELLTLNLVFASFAVGAIGAGLISLGSTNSAIQWVCASVIAVLSLTLLRPPLLKFLFRKTPTSNTGVLALIGLPARTTTIVTSTSGMIALRNEMWSARSESGDIPEGVDVIVNRIDGALAIVAPTKN